MRDRLPVHIENRELPKEINIDNSREFSYGYASILYIVSVLITALSVLTVIILGK